jgi:ABC-type nitrate/sulfonate/bicarbonate transport system substrate-binding protein
MFKSTRVLAAVTILLVAAVVLSACGPTPAPEAEAPTAAPQIIQVEVTRPPAKIARFVFAPDPVMLYMRDTGIVDKYEDLCNITVKTISTWDEVAFFAGGHADIASTGDYEIPALMAESDEEFIVFGIYNLGRVPIFVRADSPYQTIHDLKGKKIGVPGPLSSTMIWGVMLKETEGVDFRVGGGDFDLVVNDHMVNGELLRNGQIEAGVIIPEALIPEMRDGTVRLLYDVGGTWEYYRDHFDPEKTHKGVPGNIFLARKTWYDQNKDVACCIRLYPEDHGLDPDADTFDADVEVMYKYLMDHDWFVDTVYLDEQWIETEMPVFDYMRSGGFMEEDMPNPVFDPMGPDCEW